MPSRPAGLLLAVSLCVTSVQADQTTPVQGIRSAGATHLAFTGATVVVDPETVLEEATLIVREGRVVGVGDLPVPTGATEVKLAGHTVYPGFIDPYTEYGLKTVGDLNPPREGNTPKYEGTRAGANAWNDAIHAQRAWIEAFIPDSEAAASYHDRGVTSVQSVRMDGIFRGRGFAATTAEGLPNETVLAPRTAHFLAFDSGSSHQEYPSSLMGSIALVRQTLLDVQWYEKARAAWASRKNQEPPEFNRALEALAAREGAVIFETEDELTLLRAARIGREFSVPMIHVGSNFEYNRIAEIAALGEALILPVVYPEKPAVTSYEEALDVSLADLRHWERAPSNPAVLEAHGVEFAFTAHGLDDPSSFWKQVRLAVRRGLSRETALAAVTTVPARLSGIGAEAGTLHPGKRADFVVADGDLFEEGSIQSVWIGGRRVKETTPLDRTDFGPALELGVGPETYRLELLGEGDELEGELQRGDATVGIENVARTPRMLRFSADLDGLGGHGVARFTLVDVSGRLTGQVALPDGGVSEMSVVAVAADEGEGDDGGEEPESAAESSETADEDTLLSAQTYPNLAFGLEAIPEEQDIVVRNATVWTLEGEGRLENADLLVVGGRIVAVGTGLEAPPGVVEIDGTGKHVTPGIIDEHSHLAISSGVNEGSHSVTSEVRIGDVVDPDDVGIYRALAGGVTAAQLLHGSANPIGGQAQVIKHRWGMNAEEMKFEAAPPSIKFALGENVKQSNWGDEYSVRYPQTRMGVHALMRDSFVAAREYGAEWERYERLDASRKAVTVPPRRDLQLEALLEILDSERFIHCHSYVQSEILMLMRLAEDFGFRVQTFTHILEGYKVAPEMAAHGAGASTFADWWAYKFEVYDAIPYNTCLLHSAGVVTSVNSDSGELIRRLNQEAGKSVMYCGMDEVEALKLVTLNPAIQLRIDERVGSLAAGKDADFVIWNGHPLSMYSKAEQTWIDGRLYFSLERDRALREANRVEKQALIQKVLQADSTGDGPGRDEQKAEETWECNDLAEVRHGR